MRTDSKSVLRIFGEDNARVEAAGLLILRKIIEIALGLITLSIMTRGLTPEIYGYYGLALVFAGILRPMSLSGVFNGVAQSFARGSPGVFSRATLLVFLAGLFSTGFSYFAVSMAATYGLYENDVVTEILFLLLIFFPFEAALKGWRAAFNGLDDFRGLFLFDVFVIVSKSIAIIAAVHLGDGSLLWLIFASMGVPAIAYLWPTILIFWRQGYSGQVEPGNIQYGVITSLYNIPYLIVENLDKLFVFFFFGPETLALYFVALKFPQLARSVFQEVSLVFTAPFARESLLDRRFIFLGVGLTLLASCFSLLIAWFIIPSALLFLVGKEYEASILYAQIMFGGVGLAMVGSVLTRWVKSQLDSSLYGAVILSRSIFESVSVVVLGFSFGLLGIAASFVLKIFFEITVTTYAIFKRNQARQQ